MAKYKVFTQTGDYGDMFPVDAHIEELEDYIIEARNEEEAKVVALNDIATWYLLGGCDTEIIDGQVHITDSSGTKVCRIWGFELTEDGEPYEMI